MDSIHYCTCTRLDHYSENNPHFDKKSGENGSCVYGSARSRSVGAQPCYIQESRLPGLIFLFKIYVATKVLCYDDIWCEIDLKTADVHFKNCDVYRKKNVHDDVELQWCHTHKTKYG